MPTEQLSGMKGSNMENQEKMETIKTLQMVAQSSSSPDVLLQVIAMLRELAIQGAQSYFSVELLDWPAGSDGKPNKIMAIKGVRNASKIVGINLGLKEAKDLVESGKKVVFENLTKNIAEQTAFFLTRDGCVTNIKQE